MVGKLKYFRIWFTPRVLGVNLRFAFPPEVAVLAYCECFRICLRRTNIATLERNDLRVLSCHLGLTSTAVTEKKQKLRTSISFHDYLILGLHIPQQE